MGNCISGTKGEMKDDFAPDDMDSKDDRPKEDVTYASIDHSKAIGSRRTIATPDDDCDYTTVYTPAELPPESQLSSKGECDDDYVLMT